MSKTYTRIEKNFYSTKNYELLDKIIVSSVDNIKKITKDYKKFLFSHMENVFSSKSFSNNLSREERSKTLTLLNKEVLSNIAAYIKKHESSKKKPVQELPKMQSISNKELSMSRDNRGLYTNFFQSNPTFPAPTTYNSTTNSTPVNTTRNVYPQNTHLQNTHLLNTHPQQNVSLQPTENIENFPKKEQKELPNTNTMFQELEKMRSSEFSSSKPKNIDFSLPENTSGSSTNTSIEKLVQERKEIENIYKNTYTPPASTLSTSTQPSSTNTYQEQPSYQSFTEGITTIEPITEQPTPQTNIQVYKNRVIDSMDEKEHTENNFIEQSLEQSLEKSVEQSVERNITNYIQSLQNIPPNTQFNTTQDEPKEEKITYISVSSLYRKNKHQSSTNSLFSWKNKEKDIEFENTILYTNTAKYNNTMYSIVPIDTILSVECLDVIVPKIHLFEKEPFVWLCIQEWRVENVGENLGTNIPKHAFTRLKEVYNNDSSPYISLKSHIFDRKTPTKLQNSLSLELRTSDNTHIECNDTINIQKILSSTSFQLSTTENIEKNDVLYIFSYYPEHYIPFYPEIYLYDIKIHQKNTLSFRLCIHTNTEDIHNKICTFSKDDITIPIETYISTNDLFFIEYKKRNKTISSSYPIQKIQNGIITIQFPQTTKYIPTNITKIGFYSMSNEGYTIDTVKVQDIQDNNTITIDKEQSWKDWNTYFVLSKKQQIHYYFRVHHL